MYLLGFIQRYTLALGLMVCLVVQLTWGSVDLTTVMWALVAIFSAIWIAHLKAHVRGLRRSLNLANIRAARGSRFTDLQADNTPPAYRPIQKCDEGS